VVANRGVSRHSKSSAFKKAVQVIGVIAFYAAVAGIVYHLLWGPKSPSILATASCRDGTLSYGQHHQGTCSHHGGVAAWR
jgi:hypothetical protein